MKKLTGGLAFICLAVCALLACSTLVFKLWYPNQYADMPDSIRIANTGSSHGVHDFDWKQTGRTDVFNFANDSQSLYYDYQLVKHYIDHFQSSSTLFIPISYFSLYSDQYEPYESFVQRNEIYYTLLDADEIAKVDYKRYIMKNYFPALLFVPDKMKNIFKEKTEDAGFKNPQKDRFNLREIGELRSAYHERGLRRAGTEIVQDPESAESLKALIRLCQNRGVRPILITTPYMGYYNDGWDVAFYKRFYSDMENLVSQYHVDYWDYSHDQDFQNEEVYFVDTDHLSEKGAEVFLKKVLARLNES